LVIRIKGLFLRLGFSWVDFEGLGQSIPELRLSAN